MELAFADGEEIVDRSYEVPGTLMETSIAIRLSVFPYSDS